MKRIIDNMESVTLSSDDIMKGTDGNVNIVPYHEIKTFRNLNDLFRNKPVAVILYETKKNFGHWCCLINHGNYLCFFDPYGIHPIDMELKFVKPEMRASLGEDEPYLTELIEQSGIPVDINKVQYQKYMKEVNTCGRHVLWRAINYKLSNDQYMKLFSDLKFYNPDFWVTCWTICI
jgi:hypothetical protein